MFAQIDPARAGIYEIDQRYRDQVVTIGFDHRFLLKCQIRILMVTDGSDYIDGAGYNLSEVIKAITADLPPYLDIDITTAGHHSGGTAQGADINGIDLSGHDLDQYDQIWFIAVGRASSDGLSDDEVSAVWDFMQQGGGVFATGDHEDLGAALCGRIPRVRSMRRWWYSSVNPNPGPNGEPSAPSAGSSTGHNTTVGGSDFDGTPQTIEPKMYPVPWLHVLRRAEYPHPVLCGPTGPIRVLPDHMHEGAIEVPDVTQTVPVGGSNVTEYPARNGQPLPPEVIATATNQLAGRPPFGVIGAYDGHLVDEIDGGVGRIVVDATWHHFFNMNLNQFRYGYEAAQAAIANGTLVTLADAQAAAHYRQIRAYFQNIAVWLARAPKQRCIRRRGLWTIRWHLDIQMALLPEAALAERYSRFEYYLDLGVKARDAFQRLAPQCQQVEWILDLVLESAIPELLIPWGPRRKLAELFEEYRHHSLIDPQILELSILGGALHAIGQDVAADTDNRDLDSDRFDKTAMKGAQQALAEVVSRFDIDRKILQQAGIG